MENNKVTVCVIGGTGFLGSHLLKLLERENAIQVRILSRKGSAFVSSPKHFQIIPGSLLDRESLIQFLIPRAIVINLAYLNTSSKEDNLTAIDNLVHTCNAVVVHRLIHCSSAAVFGRVEDDVITEVTKCNPVTEYESIKFEVEQRLITAINNRFTVSVVRPTAIFGEGGKNLTKLAEELTSEGYFMRFIKTVLHGKRRFNLVYVENVAAAIWFLARVNFDVSNQIFIISDDDVTENNYYDVSLLLTKYLQIGQKDVPYIPIPNLVLSLLLRSMRRSNTNPVRVYSNAKLLQLGFRKPISFHEGIQKFVSWYRRDYR